MATNINHEEGMRQYNTWMVEQGIQYWTKVDQLSAGDIIHQHPLMMVLVSEVMPCKIIFEAVEQFTNLTNQRPIFAIRPAKLRKRPGKLCDIWITASNYQDHIEKMQLWIKITTDIYSKYRNESNPQ